MTPTLILLILIALYWIMVLYGMWAEKPIILITGLLLLVLTLIFFVIGGNLYKQGQIDALTGNIKYELVTHEDSTKTWETIKEVK